MRQSVIDNWHRFSEPLEGRVNSMYLDVKGLVTTCVGNLIDTPQEAAKLPWRHGAGGPLATREEVFRAWQTLKSRQDLAKLHWKYAAKLNDLRLTEEAMDELVASKRDEFYAYLRKHHFSEIDSFPADAQLGIMSMAWACGPGFPRTFANFKRVVLAGDWNGAAESCKIREEGNPGVVPRNKANRRCFQNAHLVTIGKLDPEPLWWPEMPTLPPLETEKAPPSELGPDDPTPAHPVPAPGWIGAPQLGLDDETQGDLDDARKAHNLDK